MCLRRSGRGVALACGFLLASAGTDGAEAAASFSVGDDDRIRIEVPSAADRYHVLYFRADAAATEYPAAVHAGQEGSVVLTEPLRAGQSGRYRLATFANDALGDAELGKLRRRIRNGALPASMEASLAALGGSFPGGHGDPLPVEHGQRGPAGGSAARACTTR